MEVILDLILIQIIVCMIVDLSGIIDSIKTAISKILTKGKISTTDFDIKPFSCSLCMTFWTCLIYLFITGHFTILFIAVTCLLAYLAQIMTSILITIKDILIKINDLIYKLFRL